MRSPRSNWRSLALLLALTGVLFRGLIPAGFMPAVGTAQPNGAILALCSGGLLKAAPATGGDPAGAPAAAASDECPFATAASPALPPDLPQLPPLPVAASAPLGDLSLPPAVAARDLPPPARGPPSFS